MKKMCDETEYVKVKRKDLKDLLARLEKIEKTLKGEG
jgi:hypothetical protein